MTDWADNYIIQLKLGKTVKFRPRGNSMQGRIESGQLVTVVPITEEPKVGDIVLCKVNGKQWLHLITAMTPEPKYRISNNKGHDNGWCNLSNIFGKLVKVED